nr:S8 family serine peptidase [uncultured Desulfobacter sp.]
MFKNLLRFLSIHIAITILMFCPGPAWADIETDLSVENYTKLSKQRVGRTVYEFTYSVDISNTAPINYENVLINVSSSSPHTTIIKDVIDIGSVNASTDLSSTDTFRFRQDRRYPFDSDAITFIFTGDEVPNTRPFASSGKNQLVQLGTIVQLDGSGSEDAESPNLNFNWVFQSKPLNSAADFDDPSAENPTFVADIPGRYVIQLTVNDGVENSDPDTISVNTVTGDVDVNFDNEISSLDQDIIEYCYGVSVAQYPMCSRTDLNGTGIVDEGDLEIMGYALFHSAPDPDLSNEGKVDGDDLAIVSGCMGETPTTIDTCGIADVNGDNFVSNADINLIQTAMGEDGFVFLNDQPIVELAQTPGGTSFALDRFLVEVNVGTSRTIVDSLAASVGATVSGFLGNDLFMFSIPVKSEEDIIQIMETLASDPNISSVLPDIIGELSSFSSDFDNFEHDIIGISRRPYDLILAEKAWELIKLSNLQPKDVKKPIVGIIDGVIDNNNTEFNGVNILYQQGSPLDSQITHHGTMVAGIIAANNRKGNESITGIAYGGTNGDLGIISAPISDGHGITPDLGKIFKQLMYLATTNVSVINMSFRTLIKDNELWNQTVKNWYYKFFTRYPEKLFIICADNWNMEASKYGPMGAVSFDGDRPGNVLVVGSSNKSGTAKAGFSNFGSFVDIWAPGELIYGPTIPNGPEFPEDQVSSNDSRYKAYSGTSYSAPMVTGAAALLQYLAPQYLARNPELTKSFLISYGDLIPDINQIFVSYQDGMQLNVCKATEAVLSQLGALDPNIVPPNFCNVGNGGFVTGSMLGPKQACFPKYNTHEQSVV